MLLKSYTKEIFKSKCNSGAMGIHCHAHLENDISKALPYINATLGGFTYIKEPASVTFKMSGKLVTIHSKKIAVNALKDETEAEKIISWLQREINDAWSNRDEITPSFESAKKSELIQILKLLPKSNCKECDEPTCMVFAVRVTEGAKGETDCPYLEEENRIQLKEYLSGFNFE
ncbi:MAG: Fe-S cluster protein [Desulfobacteraceae bacterium]|nr:Fe-S cluster protein [Desulfobacteraceae bacterium]